MANNNKHEVTKRTLRFLDTVKKLDPALASEADALARRLSPRRRKASRRQPITPAA